MIFIFKNPDDSLIRIDLRLTGHHVLGRNLHY